jgi:hypothetical protein
MSEQDEGGKWVWVFLLGVIVGALLMLGVGGGLWMVQARRAQAEAQEERDRALRAEEEARLLRALDEIRRKEDELAELARVEAEAEKARQTKGSREEAGK